MRTVSIFSNGKDQAVRLPRDMEYQKVRELEIMKHGDVITLRPVRPGWLSFADTEKADSNFLADRKDVIVNDGSNRF